MAHHYTSHTAKLLISCPDRPGVVAAVSQFLYAHGANILDSSQHSTDPTGGAFFMRMVFQLEDLDVTRPQFERAFGEVVARKFEMDWRVAYGDTTKRMAVFVSKYDHCLMELIWRWRSGELKVEIPFVISNHDDLRGLSESFGLPYHLFAVTKDTRAEQEAAVLELLHGRVDLIVLARYMQILSPAFVGRYPGRIINIHHSFLPAFVGANPYKHAYERGVKLIGATAHYVTSDLDEGPIIEQDVTRVSHRDSVKDLVRVGRDTERAVLARAVAAHVDDRVLIFGNKTVVF
ncbi:MAG: formyltetrahydrofolate deformylase [Deinococcota bacterium]|jgi:formyltetrahydrofolate deformylase|nr:formyltetrahydrofolate deformylase [Deinococcota bacterium]